MRMASRIFCVVFAAAVVNVAAAAAAGEQPCAPSRKFVGFAWEFSRMSLCDLAPYADELDKTPLNGIGVYLNEKTPDGTLVSTHNIMHALWSRDALQPLVPLARELTAHASMRESFIGTFRAPAKRIDWSDDARWGAIATNMAIAAWFAKAGGFRGISMDPEDYRHSGQFRRRGGDAPYEELCRLVRQRGREVFFSLTHTYLASDDPARDAAENGDLWPAFVDGILDVAPPGALIVDGNEHSYRYKAGRGDFACTAIAVRSRLSALVSPGNRDKYRRQVSVSFGLYLDMYTNPPGSSWFFGPLNGSRLGRFAANLHAAAESADEYVWFWGEKHCWADWRGKGPSDERKISHDTWESRLPGMKDEILLQKAPGEFVRNRVAKLKDAGLLRPVNANPGCTGVGDAVPPPYSVWRQKGTKPGRFFRDSVSADGDGSSLAADGVEDGAISVSLLREPKPGERFFVSTFAKGDGVSASVAWKRNGKFDWNVLAPVQLRFGAANAEGWREGEALVCVPRGADGMSLIISVRQKPDTSGICRIDAVKIQPLDLRTIDLFTVGADALGLLDGHVQGIAATDDALYMSQMKRIVKVDWNGKVLKTIPTPHHTGDIAADGGWEEGRPDNGFRRRSEAGKRSECRSRHRRHYMHERNIVFGHGCEGAAVVRTAPREHTRAFQRRNPGGNPAPRRIRLWRGDVVWLSGSRQRRRKRLCRVLHRRWRCSDGGVRRGLEHKGARLVRCKPGPGRRAGAFVRGEEGFRLRRDQGEKRTGHVVRREAVVPGQR